MTGEAMTRAIGYDESGAGQPVLFIHGFPHDRSLWAAQLSGLAARARCLAPDLPGFGQSAPLAGAPSMDAYADALAAFLASTGIARATVCGLSMGGYVAFALWRRHPALVRALVFASTRAAPDTDEARAKRRDLAELVRHEGSGAMAERQLPGMLGKSTRRRHPELAAAMWRMLAAAPLDGVLQALEAMAARPDSTPTLSTITVPTLFIAGAQDVIVPAAEMRAMHEQVAGSAFEVIAGAGHACNFERPAAFNHLLGEFLVGLDGN